jgi:hypothetical protein
MLVKTAQNAFPIPVKLAELFLSQQLLARLSVGFCSVYFKRLFNMRKGVRAFFVVQAVLAASVVCTCGELAPIFTCYRLRRRLAVYTLALHMTPVLRQARKLLRRLVYLIGRLRRRAFGLYVFA